MRTLPWLLSGGIRRCAQNVRRLVGLPAMHRRPVPRPASLVADMVQKVRYRGSPSSVGVLGALLRDEGLRVEHREVDEQDAARQDIVDVVLYVDDPAENGAPGAPSEALTARIETAISKLRLSVPRAQAQIVARPTVRT